MKQLVKTITLSSFLIFAAFSVVKSQNNDLPQPEASFFGIIVNNIDSSIHWYTSNLGFEVTNRVDNEERGFKQANLNLGKTNLELIELSNSTKPSDVLEGRSRMQGLFKIGFTVDDFDNWVEHLKSQKVTFHGQVVKNPLDGNKMLVVKDSDGNRVQFFEK